MVVRKISQLEPKTCINLSFIDLKNKLKQIYSIVLLAGVSLQLPYSIFRCGCDHVIEADSANHGNPALEWVKSKK